MTLEAGFGELEALVARLAGREVRLRHAGDGAMRVEMRLRLLFVSATAGVTVEIRGVLPDGVSFEYSGPTLVCMALRAGLRHWLRKHPEYGSTVVLTGGDTFAVRLTGLPGAGRLTRQLSLTALTVIPRGLLATLNLNP